MGQGKVANRVQRNPILGFAGDDTASRHGDRIFLSALTIICALGVLMVYSSSFYRAFEAYRDPFFYLKGHLVRLGIGLFLFLIAYHIDYHRFRRWSLVGLLFCLVLLIVVLVSGNQRWLNFFGVNLQPSEFTRIALLIFLADWCSRHSNRLQKSWSGFLFCTGAIALCAGLVVFEPSYSAAAMIVVSGGILLFLAGANIKHILTVAVPSAALALLFARIEPYRWKRVISFLHPLADPQGAGYQSNQSLIAVGSGQLSGTGFGMSGQKFYFLPEAHCDFIFSIFCEEKGFIGAVLLLLLFLLFLTRGIKIALKAPDQFGFLLAGGLVISISLIALINISVSLGLVPVTGLPLPFISYGGSALIANLAACGVILNVSRHAESPEFV